MIIVASVSCIYSIGKKEDFLKQLFTIRVGMKLERQVFLYKLAELHYVRNDSELLRGTFRVRGDIVDIIPGYENKFGIKVDFFGDEVDKITIFNIENYSVSEVVEVFTIYPSKIFVTDEEQLNRAMIKIREELYERLKILRAEEKYIEAQRLEQRTFFDLEMMREVGYCSGIENYSMHISGRNFGERPNCIFDFYPLDDYLLIIDESHVSVPQLRAMYNGDRMRKKTLVEHGFRLPSAVENRPLKFEEVEELINQVIFVSATPGDYELEKCEGVVVEQIIRPTGLLDPEISVRPIATQIDDLLHEIHLRIPKHERVLVTTLTKRMAEDLTSYMQNLNIRVQYIHSEVDTLERVEVLRNLRLGEIDVIVGVNLLREGLDLPEVSLVAILDADKEGFLRSERSLLQTAGRAARNADGLVIFYADKITQSMQKVIHETNRRRKIQEEYNKLNNITPKTVYKSIEEIISSTSIADISEAQNKKRTEQSLKKKLSKPVPAAKYIPDDQLENYIKELTSRMLEAAKNLDFLLAAEIRDEISIAQSKK